jgi:hypothetical protein
MGLCNIAALAAHGLAVTVRVRGVSVSNVRNSSENFFRNSFPAWLAARIAAGSAALTSFRTSSGTFSDIHLLIAPPDNALADREVPGHLLYLDVLSLGRLYLRLLFRRNERPDAPENLDPGAAEMSRSPHAALPRHEQVRRKPKQGVSPLRFRSRHRAASP